MNPSSPLEAEAQTDSLHTLELRRMLFSYAIVVILMLPGMTEPLVQRAPIESFEACVTRVKELGAELKAPEGKAFVYAVACEVTGSKADPA